MSDQNTRNLMLISSATILLTSAALYFYSKSGAETEEEMGVVNSDKMAPIPLPKIIEILDDLKIELTPYYLHVYKQLRSSVVARQDLQKNLEEISKQIENDVLKKHLIEKERFYYWVELILNNKYPHQSDDALRIQQIKKSFTKIIESEESLFKESNVEFPDFEIIAPDRLTTELYIKITKKIYACIRFKTYSAIRKFVRERQSTAGIDSVKLKEILKSVDIWKIRNEVFDKAGLGEVNEPTHRTMIRAYWGIVSDQAKMDNAIGTTNQTLSKLTDFEVNFKKIRQSHKNYMIAILGLDVFPGLDKIDPLDDFDREDVVPEKFQVRDDSGIAVPATLSDLQHDIQQLKEEIWTHTD